MSVRKPGQYTQGWPLTPGSVDTLQEANDGVVVIKLVDS